MDGKIQSLGLKLAYAYLDSNPDKNMPRLLNWGERFDKDGSAQKQIAVLREVVNSPGSTWYQFIKSLWTNIDPAVRKVLFENFFINATLAGGKVQNKAREAYNCNIPWAILMDPTSACNLNCIGCWAADYGHKLSLDFATLDSVIKQGKELGIHMYLFSGGEPLVRKQDILKLCEKHNDCVFAAFTNGTLIDEAFAEEMLRVKNFVPAISTEGFEESTDSRRGKGTYQAVIRAMEILRSRKLIFGTSCCYTSQNVYEIGSETFYDDIIARGAKFAWFFTYMPVGVDAVPELMVSASQREYMYEQIRRFRNTKPIFTIDFWNDGEYIDGCIAGGRRYLHINAAGDVEPCAFIHYSNTNIKQKTLLEALQSPLFMQYHHNQPFNNNHLRPCPLLDNPYRLKDMVEASGAYSTDMKKPENVQDLCQKCVKAGEDWAVTAERLWTKSQTGNSLWAG